MGEYSTTILIVDDDPLIRRIVSKRLEMDGYLVLQAQSGAEALAMAEHPKFDLILLDILLPGIDGFEVCTRLRRRTRLANTPIIMLSALENVEQKADGFRAGADDYVTKPFDLDELCTRIKAHLARSKHYLQASPLTGLPGNVEVEYRIREHIERQLPLAIAYLDIDQFKSYNDAYSWYKGDDVIRLTARIIEGALEAVGEDIFLGHLGGDDFVAILPPSEAKRFAEAIIREFDRAVPFTYQEADRKRGYVLQRDRQGNMYCFPLLTISIAICTNQFCTIVHPGQVAQFGAEIKEYLKTLPGSNYMIDRRMNDSGTIGEL